MRSFVKHALKIASRSKHPKHKLGAVVVKGGSILAKACNHPHWGKCAERRALRPHACLSGAVIYIMRSNFKCSKPCPDCMLAIRKAGICSVVFVSENGLLETVRL